MRSNSLIFACAVALASSCTPLGTSQRTGTTIPALHPQSTATLKPPQTSPTPTIPSWVATLQAKWTQQARGYTPTGTPRSPYFRHVELLQSTTIPLKPGDDEYYIRSSVLHDMHDDGTSDAILTIATYPENIFHPIVVLNGDGPVNDIASRVFPGGIPSIAHANQIFFIDINNDQREDLLISEAGCDHPPWVNPDALVGIAMNRGGGVFEDVSATVPQEAKGLRNYSLAAGDLYNDGVIRIVLPSQGVTGEAPEYHGPDRTGLLSWNGTAFVFQQNWIEMSLWWYPEGLYSGSFMSVQDIDGDGRQDLYIAGSWASPNHTVLYGSDEFPSREQMSHLAEGPYGHTRWDDLMQSDASSAHGSDVNRAVIIDFDRDGDLDIVSIMEDVEVTKLGSSDDIHTTYENVWFQVLRNEGQRRFVDVISQGRDLGRRYYIALFPTDLDMDGDMDLVGQYWSKTNTTACVQRWGTTFFLNEGDLTFRTLEAFEVFPELASEAAAVSSQGFCSTRGIGVFFPTEISADGMSGLLVAPNEQEYPAKPELIVFRIRTVGLLSTPE